MAMEQCSMQKSCFYCNHIGNFLGKFYCDLDMNLEIVILDPPCHDHYRNYECPKKKKEGV
jgi:hypothetical protein